jgi:hypothetical protein
MRVYIELIGNIFKVYIGCYCAMRATSIDFRDPEFFSFFVRGFYFTI